MSWTEDSKIKLIISKSILKCMKKSVILVIAIISLLVAGCSSQNVKTATMQDIKGNAVIIKILHSIQLK